RGGVSVVYQAIDTASARPRALKLVAPAFAGDTGAWDRVRREAQIIARLSHPSVPRVYDYGDATLPDGSVVPYVVMELLNGVVLYRMLTGRSPYPHADADPVPFRRPGVAPTPVLVVPGMPREVADICRDCMAKRPADRPDASTVALALWAVLMPPPTVLPAEPGAAFPRR